ncbi:flagellar assembly protein FliW [Peribacillus loiseleuriae]|uniref:Flagellar assembly factor FliW n=1 Tax=Peribacillus loiseleuriae TaxID=1679170 RepID=A0A0K9H002_9BACI|nr:flagellar assembly protein FliW [Peribacillus loiseleuriae]KMY51847.1 flagellar assembly protein FliW [Peribacillus loiseleuriae]
MKIQTKFHGEVKIEEKDLFTFEGGIPGFIDEKQFALLPLEGSPFIVLQSMKTREVAFIVSSPFEIFQNYEVKVSQDVISDLYIDSEKDVSIYVILTVRDPFNETTANLQAPIVLNMSNQLGKQFIMNSSNYSIRELLIPSPEQEER